jgi:hypothetical protein
MLNASILTKNSSTEASFFAVEILISVLCSAKFSMRSKAVNFEIGGWLIFFPPFNQSVCL